MQDTTLPKEEKPFYSPLTAQEIHDIAWADMRGGLWANWKITNRELVDEITMLAFPSLMFLSPEESNLLKEHQVMYYCQYLYKGVDNSPITKLTEGKFRLPIFEEAIMVSRNDFTRLERYKKHIELVVSEARPHNNVAVDPSEFAEEKPA